MEENFKVMCKEPKSSFIIRVKLTKNRYAQFLNKGFSTTQNMKAGGKSFIAERMHNSIELSMPLPFNEFVE